MTPPRKPSAVNKLLDTIPKVLCETDWRGNTTYYWLCIGHNGDEWFANYQQPYERRCNDEVGSFNGKTFNAVVFKLYKRITRKEFSSLIHRP